MSLVFAEKTETMRMAVAGCDSNTRRGVEQLLNGADFIEVVASVADACEAQSLIENESVDLLLVLAAGMPAADLDQECRRIGKMAVPPKIVVMGELDFIQTEALVFAGVSAFLKNGLVGEDLPAALRLIHRGGSLLLSDAARDTLLARGGSSFSSKNRSKIDTLNTRERTVAQGIAEGRTNGQLAGSMHLSEATVKLLVSNVMNKLGVSNRVQIAVLVTKALAA
ncbi:response regulator transcription factor [Arthrobacter sp. H35-D1]|uniref:response regulator transcription factor n=1 Tax=Arthrobacter sp. H35-D1 TaxID=3046202 RepID=UPI0024BB8C70|nr:response regulator transcription factor [Arthrobacter sp. H35-D1]MDJ0313829.1 response regulator transcription factor [Arthrobacter sp. H35-D1]